ncbi:MAG: DUF4430 domain-containing protein [Clostridiales bacterium]|nr:DUF4430 domain-containing protein [Clostridiales bacterium]
MKKKKKIANIIMIAVIAAIVAVGVLSVGRYRGRIGHNGETQVTACAARDKGVIDLTRSGIAAHLEDTAALRDGDKLSSHKGAQVSVSFGDSYLVLGENASLVVDQASAPHFAVTLLSGEVFLCAKEAVSARFDEQTVNVASSTVVLSVRTGSESIGVLAGEVTVGEKMLSGGQAAAFTADGGPTYTILSAASLSDFLLRCAQDSTATLCFTAAELSQVLTDRRSQTANPSENTDTSTSAPGTSAADASPGKNDSADTSETPDDDKQGGSSTSSGSSSTKPDKKPDDDSPNKEESVTSHTCTIEIRCDTILDNMDELETGKDSYVPADGTILAATTVSFTDGETVFDVLKRACEQNGIQLEYSYTPLYESYYVEGIHHLYEFDCGSESGWMFKVNGWFPNYGCSAYTLSQGDSIVWCYTCHGLGADVGGGVY